jgi:hypothetical protein
MLAKAAASKVLISLNETAWAPCIILNKKNESDRQNTIDKIRTIVGT